MNYYGFKHVTELKEYFLLIENKYIVNKRKNICQTNIMHYNTQGLNTRAVNFWERHLILLTNNGKIYIDQDFEIILYLLVYLLS